MTNFIPIFPLNVVVYPKETLYLHIFEPHYQQLLNDCYAHKKPFGIPTVLNNRLGELGTLMEITEVSKIYDDGTMDIKTIGVKVFRILEFIKTIPNKLYSGAIVNYPENELETERQQLIQHVIQTIHQLHHLLVVQKDFKKPDHTLTAYDMAHHVGLSIEEEYELLGLMQEDQRLTYLHQHLKKILPILAETEILKKKIKLNGHFKRLSGFEFE